MKYKADGSLDRFKCRLVVDGSKQKKGIDYDEVYSPVSRYESLRALLAISTITDMELHSVDVKTAFLVGKLNDDEIVYMTIQKTLPWREEYKMPVDIYRVWNETGKQKILFCYAQLSIKPGIRTMLQRMVNVHI